MRTPDDPGRPRPQAARGTRPRPGAWTASRVRVRASRRRSRRRGPRQALHVVSSAHILDRQPPRRDAEPVVPNSSSGPPRRCRTPSAIFPDHLLEDVLDGVSPAIAPYSSTNSAMWLRSRCISRSRSSSGFRSARAAGARITSGDLGVPTGVGGIVGSLDRVLEVPTPTISSTFLADHRNAGVPAAHLPAMWPARLVLSLSIHTISVLGTITSRAGCRRVEHRLDHPAFLVGHDPALPGHVDDLAQLDLEGERSVAEAATRVTALPAGSAGA